MSWHCSYGGLHTMIMAALVFRIHSCLVFILAWSQKDHVLKHVFADNDCCGGERHSVREMLRKMVKQSCSNKVARLAPLAFARFTRALGLFREIPELFHPESASFRGSIWCPGRMSEVPQTYLGRLNNPGALQRKCCVCCCSITVL
jgi:hypothetical protein